MTKHVYTIQREEQASIDLLYYKVTNRGSYVSGEENNSN